MSDVPARMLHMLPLQSWQQSRHLTRYVPPAWADEGFIHFTRADDDLLAVANRWLRAVEGAFVALVVDTSQLPADAIRFDDPDARYPHLYTPLPLRAVVAVRRLARAADGEFTGVGAEEDHER